MTSQIYEETPILARDRKKRRTPLPFFQFSIVILLQLAEPLPLQVIYPFAPQVYLVLCKSTPHSDAKILVADS